jgi:DNA-binding ferritin-like protein
MPLTYHTALGNIRMQNIEFLNEHLAAMVELDVHVKPAHWTVQKPGFVAIRELFGKLFAKLEQKPDGIANAARITVNGASRMRVAVPRPERSVVSLKSGRAISEFQERIDIWVNEGGAGGEVSR